ncbi:MAG: outer membrane beta-barrel protein, partial [Bacteroidota bacterium]
AKNSKFSLVPYAGIGFAKIENENEPNYNLNVNQGTLLINYAFSDADEFGLATGIGFTELSGNAFNADGSFYHERNQLRIPLLLTINYPISDSFQVFTNFGAYAQTILKDEYQFATGILEDVYEGWNFGMQFSIGLLFDFTENWSLGLQVDAQSDLSKFDANRNVTSVVNNTSTPGEQKIEGLSAIGIIARLRL